MTPSKENVCINSILQAIRLNLYFSFDPDEFDAEDSGKVKSTKLVQHIDKKMFGCKDLLNATDNDIMVKINRFFFIV